MTIQQFIEKARDGGYNSGRSMVIAEVFLDPEAWKAVGKVEGWGNQFDIDSRTFWSGTINFPEVSDEGIAYREIWRWNMHRMIDALAEGRTIEEFLATLT